MKKIELYEKNVRRRYRAEAEKAERARRHLHYSLSDPDPLVGMASFLLDNGIGLMGAPDVQHIGNMDTWTQKTRGYVAQNAALEVGRIVLEKRPRTKVLGDFPRTNENYKSAIRLYADGMAIESDDQLCHDYAEVLAEELIEILGRSHNRGLGSVHIIEQHSRIEGQPPLTLRAVFHLQYVETRQYDGGPVVKRTVRSDVALLESDEKRWEEACELAKR